MGFSTAPGRLGVSTTPGAVLRVDSASAFGFKWDENARITDNGIVVGASGVTPVQRIYAENSTTNLMMLVNSATPTSSSGAGIIGACKALPTAADQRLGFYVMGSTNNGADAVNSVAITGFSAEAATPGSNHGGYLAFETTPIGSASRRQVLRAEAQTATFASK